MMKKLFLLTITLFGTGAIMQANAQTQGSTEKILIAYFSCTGRTETIAGYICDKTGGTLYKIIPATAYTPADLNYSNSSCRANQEQNNPSARPQISGSVENMAQYDVIFLGYPIWWGVAPRIISTFLEAYDLSGKTIVPFCTSGSSGISSSVSSIRSLVSGATVLDGRRFNAGARNDVDAWIQTIGVTEQ
jgi:flavodoxin